MMTTLLPDFATPSSSILLHGERHPDACTLSGSLSLLSLLSRRGIVAERLFGALCDTRGLVTGIMAGRVWTTLSVI